MASSTVSAQNAVLSRLQTGIADVPIHDAAPIRYALPYGAFIDATLVEERQHNKNSEVHTVDVAYEFTTDPHNASMEQIGSVVNKADAAMEALLDLSSDGYRVVRQRVGSLRIFLALDSEGAELKKALITWRLDIL